MENGTFNPWLGKPWIQRVDYIYCRKFACKWTYTVQAPVIQGSNIIYVEHLTNKLKLCKQKQNEERNSPDSAGLLAYIFLKGLQLGREAVELASAVPAGLSPLA